MSFLTVFRNDKNEITKCMVGDCESATEAVETVKNTYNVKTVLVLVKG